jgi:hypothetical protein
MKIYNKLMSPKEREKGLSRPEPLAAEDYRTFETSEYQGEITDYYPDQRPVIALSRDHSDNTLIVEILGDMCGWRALIQCAPSGEPSSWLIIQKDSPDTIGGDLPVDAAQFIRELMGLAQ